MAKYCICKVCGVKFDREKIQAVVAGARRYAHQTCMPNGELSEFYEPDTLNAGKNRGKVRYNYSKCKYFRLLDDQPLRTKVLIWSPESDDVKKRLSEIESIYLEQEESNL